jgi:hypothetical protein
VLQHWHSDSPCYIPRDTRPDSHLGFYISTLVRFLKHSLYYDFAQAVINNIGTLGLPQGDTIFRDTFAITQNFTLRLPHPLFSAVPLAFFGGLSVMNSLVAGHCFVILLVAPFTWLPQSISPYSLSVSALKKEWPPLFDGPLDATSVRDFWSRRWHALFRRNFWAARAKPRAAVGGYLGGLVDSAVAPKKSTRILGMRIGGVMGVFLMSGLMHDWGLWGTGQGTDFRGVTGFFLLQGVGVIAEEALGLTRTKKRGLKSDKDTMNGSAAKENGVVAHEAEDTEPPVGANRYFMKLWTFVWVVLPATLMIDAWLRRGVACAMVIPPNISPSRALIKIWNEFAYGQ